MGYLCHYIYALNLGTFHQYDTFAYPYKSKAKKIAKKGVFSTISALLSFPSGETKHTEDVLTLLNLEGMCSTCLAMYLREYRLLLSECSFSEQFSIPDVVRKINYVYSSLYQPRAGITVPENKIQKNMPEVCEQVFQNICKFIVLYHFL